MKRRLIEDWLPIAALGVECEREGSAALKPPVNRLHVWWARRPMIASRSAILASLLDATADREQFIHDLGIHGDAVTASRAIDAARVSGERVENPYDYPRAFSYLPPPRLQGQVVLDPTAGGGSIPFEAVRLGADSVANDLNPVAALLLKGNR